MNKTFYTWKDIENYTLDIIRQLQQDNWKPDYIVGLTRGGLLPAKLLSHWYGDVPMYTLNVRLLDGRGEDCESNLWMAEDAFGYEKEPMNILIFDDINDSGKTINWIKKDWESFCLPNDGRWADVWGNTTRVATIVHNEASEAGVDYFAESINKLDWPDYWAVFPWENWWLN